MFFIQWKFSTTQTTSTFASQSQFLDNSKTENYHPSLKLFCSSVKDSAPTIHASSKQTSPKTTFKMAMAPLPQPKSLLGRHRLLAPEASVLVSPLTLGAMSTHSFFPSPPSQKELFQRNINLIHDATKQILVLPGPASWAPSPRRKSLRSSTLFMI